MEEECQKVEVFVMDPDKSARGEPKRMPSKFKPVKQPIPQPR